MSSHKQVLYLLNQLKEDLVHLGTEVYHAVEDDGSIDFLEGIQLSTMATSTAANAYALISRLQGDDLDAFIEVLEQVEFVLPEHEDNPF